MSAAVDLNDKFGGARADCGDLTRQGVHADHGAFVSSLGCLGTIINDDALAVILCGHGPRDGNLAAVLFDDCRELACLSLRKDLRKREGDLVDPGLHLGGKPVDAVRSRGVRADLAGTGVDAEHRPTGEAARLRRTRGVLPGVAIDEVGDALDSRAVEHANVGVHHRSRFSGAIAELAKNALEFPSLALVGELARLRGKRIARRVVEEDDDARESIRLLDLREGLLELLDLVDAARAERAARSVERKELRAAEVAI